MGVEGKTKSELIKELKKLRRIVKESEKQNGHVFNELAQQSPNMVFINQNGRIVYVNKKCTEIIGYSKKEFLSPNFDFFSMIAPESRESVKVDFGEHPKGQEVEPRECTILTKKGNKIEIILSTKLIKYNNADAIFGTIRDISSQNKDKNKPIEEIKTHEVLLDNLPCVALILKKGTREIIASNKRAREIGAVPGKTCYSICAERDDNCPFCMAPELWDTDEPQGIEVPYRGRYYEGIWVPYSEDFYVHYIFDITDRKKAEKALKESEEKYRLITETSADGIYWIDMNGNYIFVNKAFCKMVGYDKDELIGHNFKTTTLPKKKRESAAEAEMMMKELQKGRNISGQSHLRRKNEEEFPVFYNMSPVREHGKTVGLIGIARDITRRKKAEKALNENKEKFSKLFYSNPYPMTLQMPDTRIVDVNDAAIRELGHTRDELIGHSPVELGIFVDSKQFHEGLKLLKEKGRLDKLETNLRMKNGVERTCLVSTEPVHLNDQLMFLNTVMDITERKKVELALSANQKRLDLALEAAGMGMYDWDIVNDKAVCNEGYYKLFGIKPRKKMLSEKDWLKLVHPDDRDRVQKELMDTFSKNIPYDTEYRVIWPDKSIRWLRSQAKVFFERGKPHRMIGALTDITQKKQVNNDLRLKNEINKIFLTTKDENMYGDVLTKIREILKSDYGTFGYFDTSGSFVAPAVTREIYWDKCNVKDKDIFFEKGSFKGIWARALKQRRTLISNKGSFNTPKGHIKIKNTIVTPIIYRGKFISAIHLANKPGGYDDNDRALLDMISEYIAPVLYARIDRDRKEVVKNRAIEGLRASEERFRSLTTSSPVGIFQADKKGNGIYVNEQICKFTGMKQKDHYDVGWVKSVHPEDRKRVNKLWKRTVNGNDDFNAEWRFITPKKKITWVSSQVAPLYDKNKMKVGFIGTLTDITERKQAEEAYRTVTDNSLQGLVISQGERFVFMNKTFADIFGYSIDEMLAMSKSQVRKLIFRKDMEEVMKRYRARKAGKKVSPIYTLRINRKDGEVRTIEAFVNQTIYNDRPATQMAVLDMTDKKRIEEALRESEEKYRAVVENQTEFIVRWKNDGTRTFANEAYLRYYGLTKDEAIGTSFFPLIDKKNRARLKREVKTISKDNPSLSGEQRVILPNGEVGWNQWVHVGIFDDDGKLIEFQSVGRDITEKKNAQDALKESEARFRGIYENASIGLYRSTPGGRILMANPALVNMLGYTSFEELSKRDRNKKGHAMDNPGIIFKKLIEKDGQVIGLESTWVKRDGTTLFVRESARAVFDEDGKISYYEGSVEDITDQKRAKEALRISEEKYSKAFHASPDSIIMTHLESGEIIDVNEGFVSTLGFTREEAIGSTTRKLAIWKNPKDRKMIRSHLKKGNAIRNMEFRFKTKCGEEIIAILNIGLIDVDNEKYTITIARDITERKEVEEALKESEERYRTIFDTAFEPILILEGYKFVEGNDVLLDSYGYDDKNEILGHYPWKISPTKQYDGRSSKDKAIEKMDLAYSGKPQRFYWQHKRKDGSLLDVDVSLNRFEYKGGKYLLAMWRDITERKKAEEALLESETRLQSYLESAPDYITTLDRNMKIIYINRVAEGLNKEEVLGTSVYDYIPKKSHKEMKTSFMRVLKTGNPDQYYSEYHDANGNIFYFEVKVAPIIKNGKVTALMVRSADITERKKAEEELIRLSTAVKMSSESVLIYDLEGNILDFNDATIKLVGASSRNELLGMKALDLVSPDDRGKAETVNKDIMEKGHVRNIEYEIIRKDGMKVPVEVSLSVMRDTKGKPIGMVGITRDISERKRAEYEMKKRLIRFDLPDGNLYLVKETIPNMSIQAFKDLIDIGYKGTAISRTPTKEFKKAVEGVYRFFWLAEKEKEDSVSPKIKNIRQKIGNLTQKNVVLLDRIDYLIQKNGFKKTLAFVQNQREAAYVSGCILILSVDPSTISQKELRLLEKETREILLLQPIPLSDDLTEIMKFVYQQNLLGIMPSHTKLCNELHLSKPTARKRIRSLVSTGHVRVGQKGRSKVVELTEKGRALFS